MFNFNSKTKTSSCLKINCSNQTKLLAKLMHKFTQATMITLPKIDFMN